MPTEWAYKKTLTFNVLPFVQILPMMRLGVSTRSSAKSIARTLSSLITPSCWTPSLNYCHIIMQSSIKDRVVILKSRLLGYHTGPQSNFFQYGDQTKVDCLAQDDLLQSRGSWNISSKRRAKAFGHVGGKCSLGFHSSWENSSKSRCQYYEAEAALLS